MAKKEMRTSLGLATKMVGGGGIPHLRLRGKIFFPHPYHILHFREFDRVGVEKFIFKDQFPTIFFAILYFYFYLKSIKLIINFLIFLYFKFNETFKLILNIKSNFKKIKKKKTTVLNIYSFLYKYIYVYALKITFSVQGLILFLSFDLILRVKLGIPYLDQGGYLWGLSRLENFCQL